MAVKKSPVISREFYADLLEAVMANELEYATELLSKVDDHNLQTLSIGCSNICLLIRQVWLSR